MHPAGARLHPERILRDGPVDRMRNVGHDLRDNILSMPQVLLAALAMEAGMDQVLAVSTVSDDRPKIKTSFHLVILSRMT